MPGSVLLEAHWQ